MLIFLELDTKQVRRMKSDERKDFFDKFTSASRKGNHWFVLPKKFADWANGKDYFTDEVKNHFDFLNRQGNYTAYDEYKAKHDYLVIRHGDFLPSFKPPHRWEIGHREVIRDGYLDSCKFIVEGENSDGKFYRVLLEKLLEAKNMKYKNLLDPLRYKIVDGRGRNIKNIIKKYVRKKHIICCICDSDKLSPDDNCGYTFQETVQMYQNNPFLGLLTHTPCHEVENFLTVSDIECALVDKRKKLEDGNLIHQNERNKQQIEKIDKVLYDIEKISSTLQQLDDEEEAWLFLDLKSGLNKENIRIQNISENANKWLCTKYKVDNVMELNLPKIDVDIIDIFVGSSEAKREFSKNLRSPYWEKYFSDWVENLCWYLCGQTEHKLP